MAHPDEIGIEPAHQTVPEGGRLLIEDQSRVGRKSPPGSLLHLALQLAGIPAGITEEEAQGHLIRGNAQQGLEIPPEVHSFQDFLGAAGRPQAGVQDMQAVQAHRASPPQGQIVIVERVRAGKDLGDLDFQGPVQDQAQRAFLIVGTKKDHRFIEVGIDKGRIRKQEESGSQDAGHLSRITSEAGEEEILTPGSVPRLREGLELPPPAIEGREPIVKLPSGRFFAVAPAVAGLLPLIDGKRTVSELAALFSKESGREISAGDLLRVLQEVLIKNDLAFVGTPPKESRRLFIPVWIRLPLLPQRVVNAVARPLTVFYRKKVFLAVLAGLFGVHLWFYLGYFFTQRPGIPDRLLEFSLWLKVTVLLEVSALVHEFGHAAAIRSQGEKAGSIGLGMYLFMPVYYTDVTRAWYLPRKGRVIVDLGGIFFQMVFAGLCLLAYGLFGWPEPAWVGIFILLGVSADLDPFLRMDGYWLLSDLTGIHGLRKYSMQLSRDLFRGRFRPKGWADWVLGFYSVSSLVFFLGFSIWAAFNLLPQAWGEMGLAWNQFGELWSKGAPWKDFAGPGFSILAGLLLLVGMIFPLFFLKSILSPGKKEIQG